MITALLLSAVLTAQQPSPMAGQERYIDLNGLRLHTIDWGGSGTVLIFLTDFTDSCSIFGELAADLRNQFHCIGITRRGQAKSSRAEDYTVSLFANDIEGVMNAYQLKDAVLVGHGMAGDEITYFAKVNPDRVKGLIYLDAAYHRANPPYSTHLRDGYQPTPKKFLVNFGTYFDYCMQAFPKGFGESALQNIRDKCIELNPNTNQKEDDEAYRPVKERMDRETGDALIRAQLASNSDYSELQVPALGIFALLGPPKETPREARKTVMEELQPWRDWEMEGIKQFKKAKRTTTVMMEGASHYPFIDRFADVKSAMRKFLMTLK
ncbi:MAG: alpha/beta hydrolase [Armatimonadetes bacterium]|nr:alpha/beta hydrolase [Armatimonadota bacterium]